jgi:tRNA pseudouridine38-40 synthase
MQRFLLEIQFDGTNYHGWQIQQNANSVQAEINAALQIIFQENIETIGCGRTDTGVHASQFFLHYDCTKEIPKDFNYRINQILPSDISVLSIKKVEADFNARFDATCRTYQYFIHRNKNPFLTKYSWQYSLPLNIQKMNKAAELLKNYNEFECFSKSNTQVISFVCKIYHARWKQDENSNLIFEIEANRFLRNMVRAIVGTMIDIGKEKISIEDFCRIIESKNRSNAGASVPGKGLFLTKVIYNKK